MVDRSSQLMSQSSTVAAGSSDAYVVIFDAFSALLSADETGKWRTPYEAKNYLLALKSLEGQQVYLIA